MRFKKAMKEEFFDSENYTSGYSTEKKYVEVYKNPSLKEYNNLFSKRVQIIRGVLLRSGDLYIITSEDIIHEDLLRMLAKRNVLNFEYSWDEDPKFLKEFLCIAGGKNKVLFPADSYRQEPYDEIKEKYLEIYKEILKINNSIYTLELGE